MLALLAIVLMVAFAPSHKHAPHVVGLTAPSYAIAQRVLAQDSPLSPSLSVALETEASGAPRAESAINDPGPGDQRNLLRVAAVIAGVLLVAVIIWRQR